jgi:hypothetical protein
VGVVLGVAPVVPVDVPAVDGVVVVGVASVVVLVESACVLVPDEACPELASTSAPCAGLRSGRALGTTSVASWLLPQAPIARAAASVPKSAKNRDVRKRIANRVEAI